MGSRPQPCGVGGRGRGCSPTAAPCPPQSPAQWRSREGCHYPPRLCGVRGAAAGDGAKPALGVGVNRGGQGTCFGEPPEPLLYSPRPHPRRGPSCRRPWTLGGIFPLPHGPALRLRSPTLRAWTPPPMAPHTQHWWVLLPGTTHLGHTRTGAGALPPAWKPCMGQRPAEGPRVLRVHSFLTCIVVGGLVGTTFLHSPGSSFSPALASTKGWVLCLADMPGLSHVHAELGCDLPGTASLGRRCQRSGLQRRGPRLWGAQGSSQALPVPPGLLLPKPVFSTGFVLLLPWELSIRECWVGWAGRPGQADGRAVSGPVPGVSREGLVHPTLSTAHPAGPGHVTALGAGRVFPSPL